MKFHVIVQPRAEREIREAAQWIAEQSRSASIALRWVRSLRAKIDTLKATPKRCPVDPDSEAYGEEVRVLLYGKRQTAWQVPHPVRNPGRCRACPECAALHTAKSE